MLFRILLVFIIFDVSVNGQFSFSIPGGGFNIPSFGAVSQLFGINQQTSHKNDQNNSEGILPILTISSDEITTKKFANEKCVLSKTTMRGMPVCRGQLIFEENFDEPSIDPRKWNIEHRLPKDDQENEFVSYQRDGVRIQNGFLNITPTLQHTVPGFDRSTIINGFLDLRQGCTGETQSYCKFEANSFDILPPVISGKITTKNLFSFKYGKIEITAKLPQGDWIYPELYLEPVHSKYGTSGYESGLLRVAFARGNMNLRSDNSDYSNNVLSGGAVFDQFEPCRSLAIRKNSDRSKFWGNNYHTYGLIWLQDSIILEVDQKIYGIIQPPSSGFKSFVSYEKCSSKDSVTDRWATGNTMTPFDEEFYITLGLGVGGISDFPNDVQKPWKNSSPKAKKTFWRDEAIWFNTWNANRKNLLVSKVKVWAL